MEGRRFPRRPSMSVGGAIAAAVLTMTLAPCATPAVERTIAFERSLPRGAAPHIWLMRADGSGLQRLFSGFRSDVRPKWSLDGTRLLFHAPSGLWISDAGGKHLTRVGPHAQEGAWAPGGDKIVLVGANTTRSCSDLYLFNLRTRRASRLTFTRTCEVDPAWSPRGGAIAFAVGSGDEAAIVVESPSGNNRRTIATGAVSSPAWSPDGRQLAYADGGSITVVDISDGSRRTIGVGSTSSDPVTVVDVTWSSDGSGFVFTRGGTSTYSGKYGTVICRMNADGSGIIQLTDRDADRRPSVRP
ncbi:MAG: TolB protein [Gaiellaceae bacterium]|nr:TolB protein [Gaiellaceae bacterium]